MSNLLNRFVDFATNTISADVDNSKVTTDELNNVRYADPGEVQSVIDDAASDPDVGIGFDKARAKVALKGGTRYDMGSEGGAVAAIDIKPGVTLVGNGACLTNADDGADVNGVFRDVGSSIEGHLRIGIDGANYTSDAVLMDTDQATEAKYGLGAAGSSADTQSPMKNGHVEIIGNPDAVPGGNGLAFRGGSSTDHAISVGSDFNVSVYRMENGILNDLTDGAGNFVNMDWSSCTILGCTNHIHSTATATQFKTPLNSIQQPAGASERVVWNEGTESMPHLDGAFWDPDQATTNALVGDYITAENKIHTQPSWGNHTDGSPHQLIANWRALQNGHLIYYKPDQAVGWTPIDLRGGTMSVTDDSATEWLRIGLSSAAGSVRAENGGFTAVPNGEGIQATSPDGNTTTYWNTQNDGSWG